MSAIVAVISAYFPFICLFLGAVVVASIYEFFFYISIGE